MDAKSIKSNLREAKEAIKNKEIDKALKLCKAVLKADRNNYLALVIFGAALQESESKNDAPNAYKKAVEISPKQILAWQGLASFYEKEGVEKFHRELIPIYKELLDLETDVKKQKDIIEKLEKILIQQSCDSVVDLLKPYLENDGELCIYVADVLYKYFSSLKKVPENHANTYKKCLRFKIDANESSDGLLTQYCNFLYESGEYEELIQYCKSILLKYENDINTLEYVCRVFFESFLNIIPKIELGDIDTYCTKLLELKENSVPGLLVKTVNFYKQNDFTSCRDVLNNVVDIDSRNPYAWYFLSKTSYILRSYEDVLSHVPIALKYLPNDAKDLSEDLKKWKLEALANSADLEKCKECLELCNEILDRDSSCEFALKSLVRCCIALEKWELVESKLKLLNVEDPSVIYLKALYNFKIDNMDEAIAILKNYIKEESCCVNHFLLLGKSHKILGNNKEALTSFLKAAKLAPHVYSSFLELGNYYRDVNKDLEKARRCYQKAFQLNPRCEQTGVALSDVYRRLNCQESNFELLNAATTNAVGNWVWLRLGLYYLDVNDIKSAVNSLRTAVRVNPGDIRCWECLGDAYYARGAYTSALKCYQKCLEINSSSVYAALQIAYIKQKISLYDESVLEFRALIEQNPDYIPALKGLAEVCLFQAKELFDRQIVCAARDFCQEAVVSLTKILKQNNQLSSVWKLLADVCVLTGQLPAKISNLAITLDERKILDTEQLLDFALKCYSVAVNLNNDNNVMSFLWHDIAFCYNLQAKKTQSSDKVQFRKKALLAAKKSVALLPTVIESWNLLGLIALSKEIKNLKLAQHCFIKAIKLNNDCAVSWTNLGILYLQLEDISLANEAFQNAQRSDPKYSRSWIGQAIIAEMVDHVETVDLFYHTTQLGYHEESAKGFSEWICKVLKNWDSYKNNHHCYYIVEKMAGLPVAVTIMNWYTVHYPEDPCATNMLGVLLELCNLHMSAINVSQNSLKNVADERDIVLSNLGRQLRKAGEYEKAIECFKGIKQIDFATQCDLALSMFLAGQYEEAFSNYESAIHWFAPDEGSVAQVMVATAALLYMQKKTEEAQTVLFQCIQLKPVPVYGLFAACAFGMLNSKLKLSKLVLKELEAFKNEPEYIKHIPVFKAYCEVFQQNFKGAINIMSKSIFNHPGDASLWLSLCLLLLRLIYTSEKEYIGLSISSAYHAKYAISLGRGIIDISKICSIMSLSYLLAGKAEDCLRSSMKAVYMYPDVAENWAVLIAAHYSRGTDYRGLINIITHVRRKLTCSRPLNMWLSNIERKVTNILG